MIVQFYKSQVMVGGNLFPIPPGGGTLNWPRNYAIPAIAGNYWQQNYIEGYQVPSVDISPVLLDAVSAKNPIGNASMAYFMARTNDYKHDTSPISGFYFFDGYSGFNFVRAKANSFSISGSKGDDVRFNANYLLYDSVTPGAQPTVTTTPPDATYTAFAGNPIRFQSLSFNKEGSPMDGVLSFNISFSNNSTDDRSMVGAGPQNELPVDVNAGMQTCSFQMVFQGNDTAHIATGNDLEVIVSQGVINTSFALSNIVVDSTFNRGVGSGRQVRTYSGTVTGTSNTVGPLVVTAA